MAKYCHTTNPTMLTTPNHQVAINFHSDGSGTDAGFQLLYHDESSYHGCGGVFTLKSGEFGSPLINGQYPEGLNCEYLIQTAPESKIKFKFLSMKVESNSRCRHDRVAVRMNNLLCVRVLFSIL